MDHLAEEIVRMNNRLAIAEDAVMRLRRQLCEALQDQPEKLAQARRECGLCGGDGPCIL